MTDTTQTDPRQTLLTLVEDLKLPFTPTETLQHVQSLTDEEVDALLPSFEYVNAYEQGLEKKSHEIDPARTRNINEAYQNKTHEAHDQTKEQLPEVSNADNQ